MNRILVAVFLAVSVMGVPFASENTLDTLKTGVSASDIKASQTVASVSVPKPEQRSMWTTQTGVQTYQNGPYTEYSQASSAQSDAIIGFKAAGAGILEKTITGTSGSYMVKVIYIRSAH